MPYILLICAFLAGITIAGGIEGLTSTINFTLQMTGMVLENTANTLYWICSFLQQNPECAYYYTIC